MDLFGAPSPSPIWPDLCRLEDWFFPSPICSSPSAQARHVPLIHLHRRSCFLAISSAAPFDHHASERGPHAPASGSNALARGGHGCPESADVILRSCSCVLGCFLICSVTFCYFLLSSCFVVSPFCVVFRYLRVDFLFIFGFLLEAFFPRLLHI
jgi:hypothetical protein